MRAGVFCRWPYTACVVWRHCAVCRVMIDGYVCVVANDESRALAVADSAVCRWESVPPPSTGQLWSIHDLFSVCVNQRRCHLTSVPRWLYQAGSRGHKKRSWRWERKQSRRQRCVQSEDRQICPTVHTMTRASCGNFSGVSMAFNST